MDLHRGQQRRLQGRGHQDQGAYDAAVDGLFATLYRRDELLACHRFLLGARTAIVDWRLFTTLVRFDLVDGGHFKCNVWRIADFNHLSEYLRDLLQTPLVADMVGFDDIKRHSYVTQPALNPSLIVRAGPALDLLALHDRARLAA